MVNLFAELGPLTVVLRKIRQFVTRKFEIFSNRRKRWRRRLHFVPAKDYGISTTNGHERTRIHETGIASIHVGSWLADMQEMQVLVRLLGFQRADDFFEARIAAQRVPKRQQFQLAIAEVTRMADRHDKLFTGQIFFANPPSDHG
jgi:hypothetical protein